MNAVQAILEAVGDVRDSIRTGAGPLAVLDAIRPLLIEFSMSPAVLTDERRVEVQRRVLEVLGNARLLEEADL